MLEPAMAEMMKWFLDKLPEKGRMVEIGTGYGESTLFFASMKPGWTIYTKLMDLEWLGIAGYGLHFMLIIF